MAAKLVGLHREIRIVEAALDTALTGMSQTVLVEGELGSGRSTLLGATRARAAARGLTTLATQGRRTDRSVAHAGLLTLLSAHTDRLEHLAGENSAVLRAALSLSAPVAPIDVAVGLFQLLTHLAEEAPVCVLVDDEHLLDPASADAISFAVGRFDADAIATFVTSPSAAVSRITELSDHTLTVGPTSSEELAELLDDGQIDTGVLAEVARRAAGNPLVAISIADSLTAAQRDGSEPLPSTPPPPEALINVFEAGLREAGDGARRALVLVAADRTGDRARLIGALDRLDESPDGFLAALQAGLLIQDGRFVRLAHPLLQSYAYGQVGSVSRRAVHAALAAEYTEPTDAADRLWHLAEATATQDDDLAANLDLVAQERMERADSAGACAHFRRAAELSTIPSQRATRLRSAVKAALEGGDAALAWATLEEAPPDWSGNDLSTIRAIVAPWAGATVSSTSPPDREAAASSVQINEARIELLEGELDSLTRATGPAAWDPAEMVSLRARGSTFLGRATTGESAMGALLATLPHHRSPAAGVAAAARAEALLWLGDLEKAQAITQWAGPVLAHAGFDFHLALLRHTGGSIAIGEGDLAGAIALLEAAAQNHLSLVIGELTLALMRNGQRDVAGAWLDSLPEPQYLIPRIRQLRAAGLLGRPEAFADGLRLANDAGLPLEVASVCAAEAEWHSQEGRSSEAEKIVADLQLRLRPVGLKCPLIAPPRRSETADKNEPSPHHDDVTDALSPAELRVASTVSAGRTNKEAAAELFLSVKTVDFHLQNIYRKLRLRSRTELAILMTDPGRPK